MRREMLHVLAREKEIGGKARTPKHYPGSNIEVEKEKEEKKVEVDDALRVGVYVAVCEEV